MTSPVSPPAAPPRLFDRARVARNRDRAAANYPDYAFLKARVSRDIAERLEDTSHEFPHALELGAHDGQLSRMLMETGKIAQIEAADVSPKMVERMKANGLTARQMDEEMLEVEPASLDLIVSALSLHWVNDLPGTLIQIRKALKPDGLFLGALFGAGTLAELRACLMEAETELKGGIAPRISPLPGLQDLAALMQRAGFTLPVVDRETVTVRYASPLKLLEDLKGMGERAAFMPGTGRPLPRSVLMRTLELYLETYRDLDGKVRASFEIVHLSGWAPADSQPKPLRPGSAKASLADAVRKHGTA
ncbi:hypothetical protein HY29_07265 [Hyphomonas beringensis]|uniref:Methyltransferase type 11 domain-containing protein n=1 Tax=Hyphomonas beringensis TaxID=1280946 RepID=A0A062U311_9PROT|nr:methyltransferase domain-containing protein [Hyphomonas beringensis]KCZ50555.1 hypothetical protein HY29_07265 [Hyphomonas beringensis]